MRSFRPPLLVSLLLAAACGDSAGPVRGEPGIRVVSGGSGSDTVLAVREEPLEVEVRDSTGRPVFGALVRFETPTAPEDSTATRRRMYACPTASRCTSVSASGTWTVSRFASAVTDAEGRARAYVQHGALAGAGTVTATVVEQGYTVTASYTTHPGALAGITAPTLDTAVYVGAGFEADARGADRFGNRRADAVALEALTPSVAAASGGRVTGVSEGRARVVLRAGAFVDTLFVSVPPPGRLVLVQPTAVLGTQELVLISTDGTASRRIALTSGIQGRAYPSWSWDGRRVLFTEGPATSFAHWTYAVDTATGVRAAVIDTAVFPGVGDVSYPRTNQVLYFQGSTQGVYGVYRANGDGSGPALLLEYADRPAVSPDGGRLAYVPSGGWTVVRDLATGQTTGEILYSLDPPRWSPAGDLIAYAGNAGTGNSSLEVVRPDGTGRRVVATRLYDVGSWSPDGAWVCVVRLSAGPYVGASDGVELVRVADGVRVPVPGTRAARQVSWRP